MRAETELKDKLKDGSVNFVHFWLSPDEDEVSDQYLRLATQVAKTAVSVDEGFSWERLYHTWFTQPLWWYDRDEISDSKGFPR